MITFLYKKILDLFKSEDQEISPVSNQSIAAVFDLSYQDILIGVLTYQNKVWAFEYSDQFKQQTSIKPLIGFPDINRIYKSEELLPFFASRIPSIQRLKIQNMIDKDDELDEVTLLKKFGKKSITNPYQLIASH